ncbi:MAG TPA: hypothetical protein VFV80_03445, partial [Geminicoccaceae bacterium]|nr:hypothetical protein [Geminicoccaceae bacterium]
AQPSHRQALCEGLVLAVSYTLLGKGHGVHRSLVGPQFHSLHEMFEIRDEQEVPGAQAMIREPVQSNQRLRAHEKVPWMLRASLRP